MRILLDESLPRGLGKEIPGHEVTTVQQAGWAGLENGELLRRAGEHFDVLLTGDQNIDYQQNPARLRFRSCCKRCPVFAVANSSA